MDERALSSTNEGPVLIVLFGNKNNQCGALKPAALERCARAAELAHEYPESLILPTGAFGKKFNPSKWPHGYLLRCHLIKEHKIAPDRILPFTNSSNTVEDALFARRVAVDLKAKRIVFVTSSFHMDRVKYICRRIFPDFECEFTHPSTEVDHSEEHRGEEKKLKKLSAEWVDIPVYGDPPRASRFPVVVYVNAAREQKHYDFLSYLFISAILLVFAFPYSLDPAKSRFCTPKLQFDVYNLHLSLPKIQFSLFALSALAILLLFVMYLRAAFTARTARTFMRNVETLYGKPGFSFNYPRQGAWELGRFLSFPMLLGFLAGVMILIQVIRAFSR